MASRIAMIQKSWPSRMRYLTPVANMAVESAGTTARRPLDKARATAFRVPSVSCVGAMSLSESWLAACCVSQEGNVGGGILLKAMATPLPITQLTGPTVQKRVVSPCRRKRLQRGFARKKKGHM